MRGDPDQHEELDESTRRYDVKYHSPSSEPYLFRKSPLRVRTPTLSGRSDSPTIYPPSPPPTSSNSTPLLTATLNAPVAFYNNVRVKSDVPTQVSAMCVTEGKPEGSNSLSNSHSAFYSSLLQQLRQKTGDNGAKPAVQAQSVKHKKERTKPLPFVCPACKKRFQRHIAMNAHFQNEHISPSSASGERSCKLCGGVSASLLAVRQHLRVVHAIDLDNPTKCLDDSNPATGAKYSVLETSLRSGFQDESEPSCSNIEMYESGQSSPQSVSPSPAHTPSSSQSPERFPVQQEDCRLEEDDPQVEDLSIRKPSPLSPMLSRRFSPAPRSPRPESPCAKPSKRAKVRDPSPCPPLSGSASPPLGLVSTPGAGAGYTCAHCNIVYPNQTLYFLHRGFHSDTNPWRCNSCGHVSADLYDFNTHLFSVAHQ